MKRLESSLLEQINYEKVRKLLALYLSRSLMERLESSWLFALYLSRTLMKRLERLLALYLSRSLMKRLESSSLFT